MTRAQYIAMYLIGGIAVMAYLQSYTIAQYLKGGSAGLSKIPGSIQL